jgi:RimJ/RimL family protein N-acetyltransferase
LTCSGATLNRHLDSDQVIGFARLELTGTKAAKLGYAVHADHWGNGYPTDATRTMCTFGFHQLGLHRITAAIGPENERSIALIKSLGFSDEGRLREHVFTNRSWRNSLLYSLLATDVSAADA